MYQGEDDRYEQKRKERRDERESKTDYRPARRNRWDDRGDETGRRESDRDLGSRPSDRNKRSRSRSPFRKSYLDCANPSRDEYSHHQRRDEFSNHSVMNVTTVTSNPSSSYGKRSSNWSDSSDEDDRGQSKTNDLVHGKSSQRQFSDGRRHEAPSSFIQTQPLTNEDVGTGSSSSSGISLRLGSTSTKPTPLPKVISVSRPVKSTKIAAIFSVDDDDDEPEEMPPECKMRMKNVGRETKTSEGPNSFGKTKIGFCNMSHLAEKQLEGKMGSNKNPK